ncbi:hypothetical protein ACIRBX_00115 [Kitasatospora sp. NPDC096147]|uniref:hypothetical protein n=1 Tax=Kitasatospora sp. NPDC096147 TaxID=3364093 RepID=UPI0037F2C6C4
MTVVDLLAQCAAGVLATLVSTAITAGAAKTRKALRARSARRTDTDPPAGERATGPG